MLQTRLPFSFTLIGLYLHSLLVSGNYQAAANDLKATLWCRQVGKSGLTHCNPPAGSITAHMMLLCICVSGNRCTDDVALVAQGC
jgi:hypothetical protein